MATFQHALPPGSRRIAWDSVSFGVPANWELAVYKPLRRGAHRIELEDECSIRLEAEWIRGRKDLQLTRIMQRYETAAKPLTLDAGERKEIGKLPEGWHATHFTCIETGAKGTDGYLGVTRHDLVTAFYLCPQSSLFCFFLLHFLPGDHENPETLSRQLANTFQNHGRDALIPWQLFDIAFTMPRAFALEKTHFDIGAKLMVFRWRQRRYCLWHLSCADVFLRDSATPAEWVCGYLNAARLLKGPVFEPDGNGGIRWHRRQPFFLGHREEIATRCFRYEVGFQRMEADNKLVIWIYHYRSDDDLGVLSGRDTQGLGVRD